MLKVEAASIVPDHDVRRVLRILREPVELVQSLPLQHNPARPGPQLLQIHRRRVRSGDDLLVRHRKSLLPQPLRAGRTALERAVRQKPQHDPLVPEPVDSFDGSREGSAMKLQYAINVKDGSLESLVHRPLPTRRPVDRIHSPVFAARQFDAQASPRRRLALHHSLLP